MEKAYIFVYTVNVMPQQYKLKAITPSERKIAKNTGRKQENFFTEFL
jgi:hypothetical protein